MKTIAQVLVLLLASSILAVPAAAGTTTFEGDTEREEVDGREFFSFQPALEAETIAVNPILADNPVPLTYTVKKGDTLFAIAAAHEIPLTSLTAWNALTSDLIHPGDVLNVSREAPGSATNEKKRTLLATRPAAQKQQVPASGPPPAATAKTASAAPAAPAPVPEGRELTMTATAYTAYCNGCSGTTKIGIDLRANPNQKVIAVDPSVIPLGSRVWVEGYGEAIAGDTGGAIKGNKIDVFIPGQGSAIAWGVKKVRVKVLN
ncbi:hypothetical protein NCCP2716_21710 [Sporosarcina sp. NCCP-2716]|uniref:3D domain-containing protein n=1 Tax=Sporosarcina sp. NCCP-2716 TaxID=2943679 RepID=UPI00203A5FCE|nr:3D domain-containing protein [Sporosarcina sp. NCCP-2716]GKV69673.1 hypothetical protein NCCP2716_21710 [Sporosarcina sp. NCCP-2716]